MSRPAGKGDICAWRVRVRAALSDFVLPPQCAWCSDALEARSADEDIALCSTCLNDLVPQIPDVCRRCSAPVGPHLDTTLGCQLCRRDRFAFTQAVSVGPYREKLRAAVLRMKGPRGEPLAFALSALLWRRWGAQFRDWNPDLIVPVPHHWMERCWTPHLPPATIAESLSRFLLAPVGRHILRKRKLTPSQVSLPATRRRQNLRNAFGMYGRTGLSKATILLVDDVLTTGTTADRAARALLAAGAHRVYVAVIARGIGPEHS